MGIVSGRPLHGLARPDLGLAWHGPLVTLMGCAWHDPYKGVGLGWGVCGLWPKLDLAHKGLG